MALGAVEKADVIKTSLKPAEVSEVKQNKQNSENLSELLAGSKNVEPQKSPAKEEKSGFPLGKTLLYGTLGLIAAPFLLIGALYGVLGVLNTVWFLKTIPLLARKITHLKNLKQLRINPKLFNHVSYTEPQNLQEAKKLAEKLGIKLKIKGSGENDLDILKEALYNLVRSHNAGKGKTVMPKELILKSFPEKLGLAGQATAISGKTIWLNRNMGSDISDVTLHELGHINDFRYNRGLLKDAEFLANREDIKKALGDYAATNTDEFIAEMYSYMSQCWDLAQARRHMPEHLISLYRRLKGPAIPFSHEDSWQLYKRTKEIFAH